MIILGHHGLLEIIGLIFQHLLSLVMSAWTASQGWRNVASRFLLTHVARVARMRRTQGESKGVWPLWSHQPAEKDRLLTD